MQVTVNGISFAYRSADVLDGVSIAAEEGRFLGIMGPNGSGKTTLLKLMSQVLTPQAGAIHIDGRDALTLSKKEIARALGVVPQSTAIDFNFTVRDVVLMGRMPHLRRFESESARDHALADEAMAKTTIAHLADRLFDELSGGEKQRVIIARALCQEPRILLLDEPTTHLDIKCQYDVLDLVKQLNTERKLTIIAVFHDINLAARYCDTILLLNQGRIVAAGAPAEVLTPATIRQTYNIDVVIRTNPLTNTPYVVPYTRPVQRGTASSKPVHLICGGGSGANLMQLLTVAGMPVTAGVLNVLDSDFEAATLHGIQTVGEIPFSEVSEKSHNENLALIRAARAVVLTDFPVGYGNLKNVEAAETALAEGIPVIIIHATPFERKDFVNGTLQTTLTHLESRGALRVATPQDALAAVADFTKHKAP